MSVVLQFAYDDGGRAAAGYKGNAGDCVVRAITIATQKPYGEVYKAIGDLAALERPRRGRKRSSPRNGVFRRTTDRYLAALGWQWVATTGIGQRERTHLRAAELPAGRLICTVSRHVVAVIDGVVHDTHDPTREGLRMVYGYWKEGEAQ